MTYRVIRAFRDKENDHHTYKKGDVFPVSGEESEERIEYLMSPDNKLGEPVIEKLNQAPEEGLGEWDSQENSSNTESDGNEENAKEDSGEGESDTDSEDKGEFPIHTGGAWFELSNGEKIQGKEEAVQAEEELK
ncbi:hypothetical protein SAMN05192559_1084 [Halobacillus karajensis]|uniref:Uncharacterized protein n=1 Tax=Halobacillus karajensis TaxID=195088 RepID=A0A024P4Y4_9BACI|nr:hypothetical protein [Halobacillus karajensis]CDQ20859.1 hypothetical protein BN982_03214 [Halobacillus karajensis]CDQ23671.1 hypothetical protein BN983_01922 [Halobacillus karajensis]CDQ27149.1 hypothetical protein BN981_01403 [Halobacillus karajensis]SEI03612.1 hypothetical protein SAMN05192559_1084 [Halobacillus karajensis]